MCVQAREQKKPILTLVLQETTPECFRHALTAVVSTDAAIEMITEKFIFTGFSMRQLPVEQLSTLINLGTHRAALYFVVVQPDAKV